MNLEIQVEEQLQFICFIIDDDLGKFLDIKTVDYLKQTLILVGSFNQCNEQESIQKITNQSLILWNQIIKIKNQCMLTNKFLNPEHIRLCRLICMKLFEKFGQDDEILAQVYIKTIESCLDVKDNENAEVIFDAFNEICIKNHFSITKFHEEFILIKASIMISKGLHDLAIKSLHEELQNYGMNAKFVDFISSTGIKCTKAGDCANSIKWLELYFDLFDKLEPSRIPKNSCQIISILSDLYSDSNLDNKEDKIKSLIEKLSLLKQNNSIFWFKIYLKYIEISGAESFVNVFEQFMKCQFDEVYLPEICEFLTYVAETFSSELALRGLDKVINDGISNSSLEKDIREEIEAKIDDLSFEGIFSCYMIFLSIADQKYELSNYTASIQWLEKCYQMFEHRAMDDKNKNRVLIKLAHCYFLIKQSDKSLSYLQEISKIENEFFGWTLKLKVLISTNSTQDCLNLLQSQLEYIPDHYLIFLALANDAYRFKLEAVMLKILLLFQEIAISNSFSDTKILKNFIYLSKCYIESIQIKESSRPQIVSFLSKVGEFAENCESGNLKIDGLGWFFFQIWKFIESDYLNNNLGDVIQLIKIAKNFIRSTKSDLIKKTALQVIEINALFKVFKGNEKSETILQITKELKRNISSIPVQNQQEIAINISLIEFEMNIRLESWSDAYKVCQIMEFNIDLIHYILDKIQDKNHLVVKDIICLIANQEKLFNNLEFKSLKIFQLIIILMKVGNKNELIPFIDKVYESVSSSSLENKDGFLEWLKVEIWNIGALNIITGNRVIGKKICEKSIEMFSKNNSELKQKMNSKLVHMLKEVDHAQ
ncbi:hypothetical protein CONCODRAFT_6671 [Conidiobolus coronatus NRRL 28638]|uniref:Uncharacterized protein n=1 Tax=Conidiobolus coronatus (strain ATCC 28846 / CBS 209.66 / NRRL 28638) TaxID=796925 RepID=A0A137P6V3_CONC2|nr:hypothetical protein CONCODRAFT_6671 [Conidiobolus coronatus NRRL 28638]|eukprot:KXN70740.1 hypothetical protein CONCODRAFT_6671 [Conidiobolus coronatus NRRL 28638]